MISWVLGWGFHLSGIPLCYTARKGHVHWLDPRILAIQNQLLCLPFPTRVRNKPCARDVQIVRRKDYPSFLESCPRNSLERESNTAVRLLKHSTRHHPCSRSSRPRRGRGCPRRPRPSCPRPPVPSAGSGSSRQVSLAKRGSPVPAGSGYRGPAPSAPCPHRGRRWRRCWPEARRGLVHVSAVQLCVLVRCDESWGTLVRLLRCVTVD